MKYTFHHREPDRNPVNIQVMTHVRTFAPAIVTVLWILTTSAAPAQTAAEANASIREEGMRRSQVMDILHHLVDVHGPRLTGSPTLERAGRWALERMESYGLVNAVAEPWSWGHPGWENERLVAHMVAPVKMPLVAEVLAWTPGTNGAVRAQALHLVPPEVPTVQEMERYLDEHRDDVAGRLVLVGDGEVSRFGYSPAPRLDDAQAEREYVPDNQSIPRSYRRPDPPEGRLSSLEVSERVRQMLFDSGALVMVLVSSEKDGIIDVQGFRGYEPDETLPSVVLRTEDFGRILRLLDGGYDVTLEFEIENRIYPGGRTAYNYLAEIPGTDLADEVVMLGGHLDSWHGATGTTDNATGSAVAIEAVRILTALGLQPRRTIRVALWTGEEQGMLGSIAYVEEHFGSFESPRPAFQSFGGYINVDMGTGRLRGASVFGPTEAARVLDDILAPFDELGVAGARPSASRLLGGSDDTSFNQAGLPGISMAQDPIRYFSHTWHTNIDTYEQALQDDLKQASVIVAALAYQLAVRDELLPRFDAVGMPGVAP